MDYEKIWLQLSIPGKELADFYDEMSNPGGLRDNDPQDNLYDKTADAFTEAVHELSRTMGIPPKMVALMLFTTISEGLEP